jgi:hypothetical protein
LEFDDEEVCDSPIKVELNTDDKAFDALSRGVSNADRNFRFLEARITLAGELIPEMRVRGLEGNCAKLKDLNVLDYRELAVCRFSISETRRLCPSRGRVLPVEPAVHDARSMTTSIAITNVSYNVDKDHRDIYSLSCDRRVAYKRDKPYDSALVTVEFAGYKRNRFTGELPERAFAGEFGYWVKLTGDDSSLTHFAFYLRYVPEDAGKVLLPLLAQEAGTEVVLVVTEVPPVPMESE